MQPPTWMQHTTEHITIFTAHCKKSTLHQCSISSRILFELPLCMEWLATWKDVCRAQYGGRRLTNVDYWWQSSIRMLCSFVPRRKKIGCATFSLNARTTTTPTNQPTNPPLVSHYFTPTKIELAGQNLFWHRSFKYWAPIAGHFIWSALSAKSLHCCKSLHFGVILTLWKQWNLLRC